MVINKQRASILERYRIDPGARLRQRRSFHRAPGFAVIFRPAFRDSALTPSTQNLDCARTMNKDCWLNGSELCAVVERFGLLPLCAEVTCAFDVNSPARVLGARSAHESSVFQLNRFVLYGPENSIRKPRGFRPRRAAIGRSHKHAPPLTRAGADFVEEH